MKLKEFNTLSALTVVTSIAFERGLANANKLIEFMTGEPVVDERHTWYEGTRVRMCKEEILRQHPGLKEFVSLCENADIDRSNYSEVGKIAISKVGKTLFISPIENMPSPKE